MFGIDTLILSKPREIKTVATSFSESIRKVSGIAARPVTSENRDNILKDVKSFEKNKAATKPVTSANRIQNTNSREASLDEIEITMRKGYLKLEMVKPFARNFLKQVNKLAELKEINEEDILGKIIFSYSDSKGRWGKLENNGEKIKVVCIKKQQADFAEEEIDIYSLNEYNIQPTGIFFQVKGWGNLKELSLVNALKNSLPKLPANSQDNGGKIIYNYSLSSMSALLDGGWECKVKVIPGKIS